MKVTLCAKAEGLPNAIVVFERTDNNEACSRKLCPHSSEHFFSRKDGQIPIQQRQVRSELSELLDRLLSLPGFTDDDHVRLRIDNRGESLAHLGMIVDYEDTYLCWL
jgi:hypothetical protein